ncbi:ketopantoate reductase family protein [Leptospira idonii]|uniref:2-dehydropantoate 2-reductase n=1 Tax=Leptospira idonii TaxID=1193500 RepID=A0A4R9M1Q4_9LEPT|nr:2-dehydropantoate 2-reductase [Leptospira idonii]TGN20002.1 ketopantoate reductase family protein [Leptospira idonii]
MNQFPQIAILGMGAITATIARALSKNGIGFQVLARDKSRKEELKKTPILFRYESQPNEKIDLENRTVGLEEVKEKFDYIILGAKSANLPESVRQALPLLKEEGKLVFIQNGFPDEWVSFPKERILGGVVGWNTQKTKEGIYFQSNAGALILGGPDGQLPDPFWKKALEPYIPVILTNNLTGYRWHKLGINSVINGLAASCKLTLGELLFRKQGRKAAIRVLTEVRIAMETSGVKEEVVPGSVSLLKIGEGKGDLPAWIKHIILMVIGLKYYRIRTSMVQDLDAGRQTEIKEINGKVVETSKNLGIKSPVNEAIVSTVQGIQKGEILPDLSFLETVCGL